jgi:hypothetical protein
MTDTIKTGSVVTVTLPAGKRLAVTAGSGVATVIRYYNEAIVDSTSLAAEEEIVFAACLESLLAKTYF